MNSFCYMLTIAISSIILKGLVTNRLKLDCSMKILDYTKSCCDLDASKTDRLYQKVCYQVKARLRFSSAKRWDCRNRADLMESPRLLVIRLSSRVLLDIEPFHSIFFHLNYTNTKVPSAKESKKRQTKKPNHNNTL